MIERLLGVVLLLAVFACAHPRGSVPGGSTSLECIHDENDARACLRKGRGFQYGPVPYIHCSGVPPGPDDQSRHTMLARSSPCACIDDDGLAERRAFCSELP